MPKFKLIYDVPHDAPQYLGAIEDVTADDDAINAALPNAAVGTLITAAGYRAMKQKQADGSWKPFSYTPSESGMVNPSDATATAADILSGKTAYIADGTKAVGTIPSQAAQTITPTTTDQTIAAGSYLSGDQTIEGDANLVAGNIKSGVSIFGVAGSLLPVITGTFTGSGTIGTIYAPAGADFSQYKHVMISAMTDDAETEPRVLSSFYSSDDLQFLTYDPSEGTITVDEKASVAFSSSTIRLTANDGSFSGDYFYAVWKE